MDDRDPAARSRTMAAIKSRDTSAERRIRSALHRAGVRFRLGQQIVTGGRRVRPDIVFRRARVALFIDGCFWHGCPQHCRMPSSNVKYWNPKIERNRTRDQRNDEELRATGWTVVRVWEHDDPAAVVDVVTTALGRAP